MRTTSLRVVACMVRAQGTLVRICKRHVASTAYHGTFNNASLTVVRSDAGNFFEAAAECQSQLNPLQNGLTRVQIGFVLPAIQSSLEADLDTQSLGKPVETDGPTPGGEAIVTERYPLAGRRRRLRRSNLSDSGDHFTPPVQGLGPLNIVIGCTAGDFCEGTSGSSLLMASLDIPSTVTVETFVVTGPSLPALKDYGDRIARDDTHFVLLASPSAHPRQDVGGLVARLLRVFPRALIVGGTAVASSSRAVSASLYSTALSVSTTTTVLGLAFHGMGHSKETEQLWHALLAAVFSEVEFDGFLGLFTGSGSLASSFAVNGIRCGKQQPIIADAAPGQGAEPPLPPPPMPIFCVERPLAPGETMNVRIFEPRYRLMVKQYFSHRQPFCVSLQPYVRPCEGNAERDESEDASISDAPRILTAMQGDSAPLPAHALQTYRQARGRGGRDQGESVSLVGIEAAAQQGEGSGSPSPEFPGGASGSFARVGTVATVTQIFEVGADGSYLLQLRGHERIEWGAAFIAPRTYGLRYGVGTWMQDVGRTIGAEAISLPSTGGISFTPSMEGDAEAALCVSLVDTLATVWQGTTTAHALLRKVLRDTPAGALTPPEGASPETVSWHYTSVLPVSGREKQSWLEMRRTSERLSRQLEYLHRRLDDLSFRTRGGGSSGA